MSGWPTFKISRALQAATVKRQLQLMLPGIAVYLDMDDLQDAATRESLVERSTVILLFLSRGYFQASSCLSEVTATLGLRKPYLFVHERDPKRGGAPLEALKLELADEEQRAQLFDGRAAIPWHRISAFQVPRMCELLQA